jgi:hypothetical protein
MSTNANATLNRVRQAARDTLLQPVQSCKRPMPPPSSPIVLCVIRNESERLAILLRHHRDIGVERFVFIDNGSTDDTMAQLRGLPDVDIYRTDAPFSWISKQGWLNAQVAKLGYDRWYIVLDADEQLVFEGFEGRTIQQFVRLVEGMGLRRVRGFLLDTYPDTPLLQQESDPTARLFDATGYRERVVPEYVSTRGGVRARVFGHVHPDFKPELTKYPLFRIGADEVLVNPHYLWPYAENFRSPRLVALLHNKFTGSFPVRMADALQRKNYWNDSFEYRCYEDVLVREPTLRLRGEGSVVYKHSAQLAGLGLIVAPEWPQPITDGERTTASGHRTAAPSLANDPPGRSATVMGQVSEISDGIGLVTVNQVFAVDSGYTHLDVTVSHARFGGAVWSNMRCKVARDSGSISLEFRDSPDWPVMFDLWPGHEQDQHGRLFRVTGASIQETKQRLAGTQPGRVMDLLIHFLPQIVDAALRQSEQELPEDAWIVAAETFMQEWELSPAPKKEERFFSEVAVNQIFDNGQGYAHIDLSVFGLMVNGRSWPEFRFKIARDGGRVTVEFRRLADWPAVFDPWPGIAADEHGDYLRIAPDEVEEFLAMLSNRPERDALLTMFRHMPLLIAATFECSGIDGATLGGSWLAAAKSVAASTGR